LRSVTLEKRYMSYGERISAPICCRAVPVIVAVTTLDLTYLSRIYVKRKSTRENVGTQL